LKLTIFFFSLSFSIDSRLDIAVAASPGGDIAEFVHAVAAFEHVNQIKLTSEEIGRLFHEANEDRTSKNPFMFCNDEQHFEQIRRALRISNPYRPADEREMESVLDALLDSENHGDVHLADMLRNPSLWRVRKELLNEVIRIVYRAVITADEHVHTILILLRGNHEDQDGLVRVQNVMPECSGLVPMLTPRGKDDFHGPYAVMGYGDTWRPLRAKYADIVVNFMKKSRSSFTDFKRGAVSDLLQQYGMSREEQAVLMSKRTNVLQLYDVVFDV